MAFDDYLEPEVAVTAAVTAAVFSPKVRGALRRATVYTLARALDAKDALTSLSRNVGQGMQGAGAAVRHTMEEAKAGATEAMNGASHTTGVSPTARVV